MSPLKLFRNSAFGEAALLSHALQSEIDMAVSRLLGIKETTNELSIRVRWNGLEIPEGSYRPGRTRSLNKGSVAHHALLTSCLKVICYAWLRYCDGLPFRNLSISLVIKLSASFVSPKIALSP